MQLLLATDAGLARRLTATGVSVSLCARQTLGTASSLPECLCCSVYCVCVCGVCGCGVYVCGCVCVWCVCVCGVCVCLSVRVGVCLSVGVWCVCM